MRLLSEKVALIAGVGPGLGIETARAFAREGARIVLMARRRAALESACDALNAAGGEATIFVGDVSDPAACDAAALHTQSVFGQLDILVANAFFQGSPAQPSASALEDWRQALNTNVLGPLCLARAAAPLMARRGGGSIIMVGSNQTWEVVPGYSAYAASKGALVNLTQHLAREFGAQKIRVNAVHPGLIMGEAARGHIGFMAEAQNIDYDTAYQVFARRAALNHIAEPSEIAGSLVFFASDLSRVITGQSLCVDAGMHFH